MRYFFEVSYKGTHYHGWQSQKNAISVQQVIENTLETIFRRTIKITGSGRTDAGVHCKQQYFHADFDQSFDTNLIEYRINSLLPADIAISSIKSVSDDAHARFDAVRRSYKYVINLKKDPFYTEFSYFYRNNLNIPTMNEAASLLIGRQNFQSFSKVKTDVSNFVCEITKAEWIDNGEKLEFHISANRFLRGMVRAVVGTLLEIGKGKTDVADFKNIIASKDRAKAGAAVPPQGLYLVEVNYPAHIFK